MTSRLFCFIALIATMFTGSMAFQCYTNAGGSTTKADCSTNWCLKGTTASGDVGYTCAPEGSCSILGNGCQDGQAVLSQGLKSMCCCNSTLCNSATLHTQHIWLGVISFIVSVMLLA
uniref:Uncharacterized protein n=1 Tax=Plectus sambesii TaxID=2011161 RepID=A0A914X994_9BILA